MSIVDLNFRNIKDKCEAHNISDEVLNIVDQKAYLLEAIEYENGSYAPVTIIDGNNNQLVNGDDYILTEAAGLITFTEQPTVTPYKASYRGIGSIIWSQDVKNLQAYVSDINTKALDKTGDTLEGELNVNSYNLKNVSTINNIVLWSHDHTSGNGNLIPSTGLANDSVTTAKILDGNVTTDKLSSKENGGNAAVDTNNIKDGAVTNDEIAESAVTNSKIQNNTITFDKLNKLSLLNALYPIGAIYINTSNTCQIATVLGGTWEHLEPGYYLQQKLNDKSLGDTVDAGLPNITGSFQANDFVDNRQAPVTSGAIYTTRYIGRESEDGTGQTNCYRLVFDASRDNAVYGKSNTVQTNAFEVNIWRRIG